MKISKTFIYGKSNHQATKTVVHAVISSPCWNHQFVGNRSAEGALAGSMSLRVFALTDNNAFTKELV